MTKRKKKRSLSRKRTRREVVMRIAWYTPDQFAHLKAVAEDAENLHDTHADWLKNMTGHFRSLKKEGYRVVKVPLDVETWAAWCRENDKPLTGASRSEFVALKASDKSEASSPPGQFAARPIKPRPTPTLF